MKKPFYWNVAAGIILILLSGLLALSPHHLLDPDLYYHLAISKLTAQSGLIRSLPQVQDLNWGTYFPDKEFLFHQFTALGYRMGGDTGVLIFCRILCLCILALLVYLLMRSKVPLYKIAPLFILCLGLNQYLLIRLVFVRPHLPAIFCFFLLILGLNRRCRWTTLSACFFYALSYHAFYMPLMLLGIYGAVEFYVHKQRRNLLFLSWGIMGLGVGILVNPYFPSNLSMSFYVLSIALRTIQIPFLNFGTEVLPLSPMSYFSNSFFFLMMLGIMGYNLYLANRKKKLKQETTLLFIYCCSVILWILVAMSPRAMEYAIPMTFIALGFTSVSLYIKEKQFWAAIIIAAIAYLPFFNYQFSPLSEQKLVRDQITPAITALGSDSLGKKVFNCVWGDSPFLLYQRPDLKFVDILDPTLLYQKSPQLYLVRALVARGMHGDPYAVLRDVFGADYVLCDRSGFPQQVENDFRFEQLFPEKEVKTGPLLYRIKKVTRHPRYVRAILIHTLPPMVARDAFELVPRNDLPFTKEVPMTGLMLDLYRFAGTSNVKYSQNSDNVRDTFCAQIRIENKLLRPHIGRRSINVGGGRNVRIWLNRKQIFDSKGKFTRSKLLQKRIYFGRPLTKDDRVDIITCSQKRSNFWTTSVSFW